MSMAEITALLRDLRRLWLIRRSRADDLRRPGRHAAPPDPTLPAADDLVPAVASKTDVPRARLDAEMRARS
jgi:hypothetical protein